MAIAKLVMKAIDKDIEGYANKIMKLEKEEVHVQSGALRDSVRVEKIASGHYRVGIDTAILRADPRNVGSIDYSVPYHDGHKPYTIRPKNAKALRWVGKDGNVHFAKSVRIPASAGDPFIKRAVLRRPKI